MIENNPLKLQRWISPFVRHKMCDGPRVFPGVRPSYGLSETGYDIRLGADVLLEPGRGVLGISLERLTMPVTHCAKVIGKSTLARLGVHLNVTEIDPGFIGHVTLEISYLPVVGIGVHSWWEALPLPAGLGIGLLQFHELTEPRQYVGKYQDAGDQPQRPL